MQLLSDISCIIQQPCWTNIKLRIYSFTISISVIKTKRRQGAALCFEMFYYNMRNNLWNFVVQLYLKNNREKHWGMDVFSFAGKYLVQPFPLEWNSNLYENCNDPCEVNVTHNLGRKRRKHENNSTVLIEPFYPREIAQAIPRQLIMSD